MVQNLQSACEFANAGVSKFAIAKLSHGKLASHNNGLNAFRLKIQPDPRFLARVGNLARGTFGKKCYFHGFDIIFIC